MPPVVRRTALGHTPPVSRRLVGTLLRTLSTVLGLALAVVLVWLRPFSADADALEALDRLQQPGSGVEVVTTATYLELRPTGETSGVGLVFQPGARVDHRAYVRLLAPYAEAGHVVVVLAQPYGIAFTAAGAAADVVAARPQVRSWVLAGHSLGGVVAAGEAVDLDGAGVDGLLLWGSYPLADLSGSDLDVVSVSGSQDGLSTPSDIDASRADLPPTTVFVEVRGATHAFFGDYGPQPGDGLATVDRDVAQAEIVRAGLDQAGRLGRGLD